MDSRTDVRLQVLIEVSPRAHRWTYRRHLPGCWAPSPAAVWNERVHRGSRNSRLSIARSHQSWRANWLAQISTRVCPELGVQQSTAE